MSDQVQLQSDIGSLGLSGLGAFSHVLAALSADDIAPMATLQMEQLGSKFNVNGPVAANVPESLTRVSARPLGRLALSVGWRKGDSVSLLAESAGGQAVSLLSVCLTNLYRKEAVGEILKRLCDQMLPKQFAIAGVAQLADVAVLLASKLNRLGFGNVLAKQAVRVLSVYESLRVQAPQDLLETPSVESMINVFECLSCLTEEGSIIRIRGTFGTVLILGIILFMFPLDAVVTVESFIIHEGPNRRIMIEISAAEATQVHVEKELAQPPFLALPVKSPEAHEKIKGCSSFEWQGWLARKLELEFARFGVTCTQDVLVSCCNMLVVLAPRYRRDYLLKDEINMPSRGIEGLLGPYSRNRIERVCEAVFGAIPNETSTDIEVAWGEFVSTLEQAVVRVICTCSKCNFSKGWRVKRITNMQILCRRHQLWETVGRVVTAGLYCLPVNVGTSIAIPGDLPPNVVGEIVSRAFDAEGMYMDGTTKVFLNAELATFSARNSGSLGRSSGASTIFPTVLETLEVSQDGSFTFELVDGLFMWQNRYYYALSSHGGSRARAKISLHTARAPIIPSNCGEHLAILPTIREGYNELLFQVTARTSGSNTHVDIASAIIAYIGLARTQECEHRLDYPLSGCHRGKVLVTGVAMPRAAGNKLSLVMARSNSTAQFLSCDAGARCMLVQGCCLDCGVTQAGGDFDVLIIS